MEAYKIQALIYFDQVKQIKMIMFKTDSRSKQQFTKIYTLIDSIISTAEILQHLAL